MSKISVSELEKIARLSRIELSNDEKSTLASEVSSILDFIELLQTADTSKLKATSQVVSLTDVWREDKIERCKIPPAQLLAEAPQLHEGYVKVKKVL